MPDEAPEMLDEARAAWLAAANEADPAAYARMLTEDAVWFPPGMPAIEGRTSIRAWLSDVMDGLDYTLELDDVTLSVAGRWAVEEAAFQTTMTDRESGETGRHTGLYLALWSERPDGRWRIDRYVDRTDREDA